MTWTLTTPQRAVHADGYAVFVVALETIGYRDDRREVHADFTWGPGPTLYADSLVVRSGPPLGDEGELIVERLRQGATVLSCGQAVEVR